MYKTKILFKYCILAGSWNPATQDQNQYIQVEFPRREPVYGVKMQGSPLFDQYVTSYKVLYSDDGVSFSTVNGPDGKPKVIYLIKDYFKQKRIIILL